MIQERSAFIANLIILAVTVWVLPTDAQLDKLRKHKKDAEVMQGDDAPMALVPE